jgi:hypothetical protein
MRKAKVVVDDAPVLDHVFLYGNGPAGDMFLSIKKRKGDDTCVVRDMQQNCALRIELRSPDMIRISDVN